MNFNPRSRTGSDLPAPSKAGQASLFQPTLPHRERPVAAPPIGAIVLYFNPRSRTGSDRVAVTGFATEEISTHAPAQGATRHGAKAENFRAYFNPRSRTGSDGIIICPKIFLFYFNPRSRTGSDAEGSGGSFCAGLHFNPRSRTGSDGPAGSAAVLLLYFNPRSRTGSDGGVHQNQQNQGVISTHAPAQGATRSPPPARWYARGISTHAPAQGATSPHLGRISPLPHFNPRSRTGSDRGWQ